jgi:thioredoxin 1
LNYGFFNAKVGLSLIFSFNKNIKIMTQQPSFNDLIQSETPVLVDFSAEWCGPCKMLAPVLSEVKKKVGNKVKIIKIDIDKNPNLATSFKVQSVPTLIVFQKGETKWRQSGLMTAVQLEGVLGQFMF